MDLLLWFLVIALAGILSTGDCRPLTSNATKKVQQEEVKGKEKKSDLSVALLPNGQNNQGNRRPLADHAETANAKKKGTIRISGPWNSDSAMDRNMDPMEDSYVKKIIASNEGLNFNKDLAEAGEVFDANGIEDFYDKNALITYEVNGHEIPVNLKPKYTPQSQPMFPEYGHDSPPSLLGMARTEHSHNSDQQSDGKMTTFSGLSSKDMPEYKVKDTPSITESMMHNGSPNDGHVHIGGNARYNTHGYSNDRPNIGADAPNNNEGDHSPSSEGNQYHDNRGQNQPDISLNKLAVEFAQAQAFEHQEDKVDNKLQSQFEMHHGMDPESSHDHHVELDTSQHAEYFHKPYLTDKYEGSDNHNEHTSNGQQFESESAAGHRPNYSPEVKTEMYKKPMDNQEYHKVNPSDDNQDYIRPSVQNEYYHKDNDHHSEFHEKNSDNGGGHDYDVSKLTPSPEQAEQHLAESHTGDHPAEQRHQDHPSPPEESSSTKFFEQLEKLDQQKQKDQQSKPSESPSNSDINITNLNLNQTTDTVQKFTDDSEKSRAKHKLLSILGDLTSKLKGMEEAVKETHTDERREGGQSMSIGHDKNRNEEYLQNNSHSEHHVDNDSYSDHKETYDESSHPTGQDSKSHDSNSQSGQYIEHHEQGDPGEHNAEQHKESQDMPSYEHVSHNNGDQYNTASEQGNHEGRYNSPTEGMQLGMASNNWSKSQYKSHNGVNEGGAVLSDPAVAEHQSQIEQQVHEESKLHTDEESHSITKFRDHDKPFIFDTRGVDYKGPHIDETVSHIGSEASEHHSEQVGSNDNYEYHQSAHNSPHGHLDDTDKDRHSIELMETFFGKHQSTPDVTNILSNQGGLAQRKNQGSSYHENEKPSEEKPSVNSNERPDSSYHGSEKISTEKPLTNTNERHDSSYHESGKPSEENHLTNTDQLHDSSYHESGKLSEENHLTNTDQLHDSSYHESGKPSEENHLTNTDQLHDSSYHENGKHSEDNALTHSNERQESSYHEGGKPSEENPLSNTNQRQDTPYHDSEKHSEEKPLSNSQRNERHDSSYDESGKQSEEHALTNTNQRHDGSYQEHGKQSEEITLTNTNQQHDSSYHGNGKQSEGNALANSNERHDSSYHESGKPSEEIPLTNTNQRQDSSYHDSEKHSEEKPLTNSQSNERPDSSYHESGKQSDEKSPTFTNERQESLYHESEQHYQDKSSTNVDDSKKLENVPSEPHKEVKAEDDDLPDYNDVKDAAIFEHNLIRKRYHADALHWSDLLSDQSQRYADEISKGPTTDISTMKRHQGANIALIDLNSLNVGKDSADMWGHEVNKFDFVSPSITRKNQDFVQMAWKNAKDFGIGVAKSKDRSKWIVVSLYDTPMKDDYKELKANLESDIPINDPYGDIIGKK